MALVGHANARYIADLHNARSQTVIFSSVLVQQFQGDMLNRLSLPHPHTT